MKTIIVLALVSAFSTVARADQFAYKVFTQNEGKVFVGKNSKQGPCTVAFFDATMYSHFSKDLSGVGSPEGLLEHYMNSISPGHFTTNFFTWTLVHKSGGQFSPSCFLMGRCIKGSTELKMKSPFSMEPKVLIETFGGKETDRCTL